MISGAGALLTGRTEITGLPMANTEHFLAYLKHYSRRDIDRVSDMLNDDVVLRDWNISVVGKAAALAETGRNFESVRSIEIEVLALYGGDDAVAGELRIVVDGTIELYVVDVISFDSNGKIKSIRAYLGRGDDQGMKKE